MSSPAPVASGRRTSAPQLSESTIQRMLDVQESKISLELKQAEISLAEIDHNRKIADKSIEAQAEDRKDERQVLKDMQKHRLWFGGFSLVACIAFILMALHMNKDALVLDLVKVLAGFAAGAGAASYFGKRKRQDSD